MTDLVMVFCLGVMVGVSLNAWIVPWLVDTYVAFRRAPRGR